jgi:hypothetical protein
LIDAVRAMADMFDPPFFTYAVPNVYPALAVQEFDARNDAEHAARRMTCSPSVLGGPGFRGRLDFHR